MPLDSPHPAGVVALEPDDEVEPAAPGRSADGTPPRVPPPTAVRPARPRWLLALRDGVIVSGATVAITAWLFKVWEIPLRRPFLYQRDGLAQLAEIKGILENGWYQLNPHVGYPVGFDHRDFPIGADNLQWAIVKFIGFFSHDAVLVTNLYYFLSFVLVALTAYFVTQYLGVSRRLSFVVAILYTFLPYHFMRGTWNLSLAAYFTVPISCLLTILVWRRAPPFFHDDGARIRLDWKSRGTVWLVVACLAIASTGIYYAAFCVVLMGCAGALRLLTERNWRSICSAVLLSGIIAFGIAVNILPSLSYWREHGKNLDVGQRTVAESDFYALRPIQLLSPIPGYRIDEIGKITNHVLEAPNNSEATQFLGAIGSIGLLGLLVALFGAGERSANSPRRKLVRRLGALTGIAIVLGVTGGLEWVIGIAGFTQIRAWNRISVFIGFYALVAVGLGVDWLVRRSRPFPYKSLVVSGAAVALVVVGVLDQTSSAIIPDSRNTATAWNSDDVFVKQIERTLGAGGAVFQLPYLPFPEAELSVPPYGMVDYDPLRGYLHSKDLYWGYGGTRGRAADWQAQVVKQATPKMLDAITAVGFDGLWIDTLGYPNQARDIIDEVEAATGKTPIVSPDGRFVFFDLRDYAEQVRADLGPSGARALKAKTLRDLG